MGRRALQARNHSRSDLLLCRSVEAHAVDLEELAPRSFIGQLVERNILALPSVLVKRVAKAPVVGSVARLRRKDREFTSCDNDRDGTGVAGDVVCGSVGGGANAATADAGVLRDHFGAVTHDNYAKVVVVLGFSAVFDPAVDAVGNAHGVATGNKRAVTKAHAKVLCQRIGTARESEEERRCQRGMRK